MEQTEAQSSWPNTLTSFMVKFQSYMVITFALAVDNHVCLISLNALLLNLRERMAARSDAKHISTLSSFFLNVFVYLLGAHVHVLQSTCGGQRTTGDS